MATSKKTPPPQDYRPIGQKIATQMGIPWDIFNSLITHESNWNNDAVSPVGARGFGQLMPGTAAGLGVDPSKPIQNLTGAAKYFKQMLTAFHGDVKLALAAYNAGPGAVQKYGGIPPYAETQAYVRNILASAGQDPSAQWGEPGKPPPTTPPPPPNGLAGMVPGMPTLGGSRRQAALNFALPTDSAVDILNRLGGTAGRTAKAAQSPITLPQVAGATPSSDGLGQISLPGAEPIKFPPMLPIQGQLQGQMPMVLGGQIEQTYPNLRVASTADWRHINPALLKAVDAAAKAHNSVAVINSGYRSTEYNKRIGGAQDSRHQRGLALDAYINGHPIGEVIPPEYWAKKGIRSGNVPGFFNGKADPMHLDMAGIPLKPKKEGPKA